VSEGTRRTPSFLFVAPDGTTHTFYAPTAKKAAEYAAEWAEKQGITLEKAVPEGEEE
jgi:hypothetical protein